MKDPKFFLTEVSDMENGGKRQRYVFFDYYDGDQEIQCYEGQRMEFKTPKDLGKSEVYGPHLKVVEVALQKLKEDK